MKSLIKANLLDDANQDFVLPILVSVSNQFDTALVDKVDVLEVEKISDEIESLPPNQTELQNEDFDQLARLQEQKQEAFDSAYRQGYESGLADVKARYDELFNSLNTLLIEVRQAIPEHIKKNESIIAKIIFAAVTKIIGEAVMEKSKAVQIIQATIEQTEQSILQQIYVSPGDFKLISQASKDLKNEEIDTIKGMVSMFKPDPSIRLGGCRIDLKDSIFDASLEKQLMVLLNSLVNKTNELTQ